MENSFAIAPVCRDKGPGATDAQFVEIRSGTTAAIALHCADASVRSKLRRVGTVFDNSPIEPTVIAVQVAKIHFNAGCRYCRDGRRATTNVRPVDSIGRPMGDVNVCRAHAERMVERARSKGLAVEVRG